MRASLKSFESLAVVAPYLDKKSFEEALNEVETHWIYVAIPLGVDALAPYLTQTVLLNRAVAMASAINDRFHQVLGECGLARQSAESLHSEILHDAMVTA